MADKINETDIIERLNSAPSVRGFFIAAVDVFNDSIDALMQRIFQKDNFAVQSVVGPLLHDSGPLGDLSVRLKLLFGLGVLPNDVYHDIEDIIKIKNELNSDAADYQFTDPNVLQPIKKLNLVKKMGMVQLEVAEPDDDIDLDFYQLQLQRQQQIIKSGLSLAIVEICNELGKESPF
ncbi:MltR family transcriptional regulator [Vibrio europaeus]|jgi:mannitol operon repressor|uniref:Transcriptional regulator n=2 Tax=Vibrio oreintalis group TaxID=1891919 RepID=A0A178JAM5_9VIBR|nr:MULTISPECIES: MltR family transcriptional regulator [Vibrio oreintalis group]MCG9583953.1 MltR family transcriptional regulator [Vibrio tubiashii]MCG9617548.1 MltR family transcriptional regulator [Vibrio tubiashii]MCG9685340.1 MltR family transcriptional regulator [Vibrio tubiashii]MDC5704225.1 MltR family transcriptional regulator [Vibrio europaeus]MDC5707994.1 MltR family transcriptional regulator [Vibrio europaeus]